MTASPTMLVVLLAAYAAGTLWIIGLLWLTVLKFSGWMTIERPAWLFGSVPRAMIVALVSAAALIAFDMAVRRSGAI